MSTPSIEEAALSAKTAIVMGHGGGSDCLVSTLVGDWLGRLGVERVVVGGIACQWWPPPGKTVTATQLVVGPDFYNPHQLTDITTLNDDAVLVSPESRYTNGCQPHEATAAKHFGGESFVISLLGGARGVTNGMLAAVRHFEADLLVSVDVGSDTLSTGDEIRPTQTSLADHLTLAGLLGQECLAYFALAGYGVDGEMEISELDHNLSLAVKAGALRGVLAPSTEAFDRVETLHGEAYDPVGSLVIRAGRGDFGVHRTIKSSPFGEIAHVGPASLPIWVFDPTLVAQSVARHAQALVPTDSLADAVAVYRSLGRIPEVGLTRFVDFDRN